MTNREIYLLVRSFEEKYKGQLPSLEEYLRSLWLLVSQSNIKSPTIDQFAIWLEQAFTIAPSPFDSDWLKIRVDYGKDIPAYEDWEKLILFQIADLRRMADAGQLKDEYRYFGIDSPSGSRWYNFDPLTYLECGIRGSIGGYEEDEVIVLIPPEEGDSANSPVYEIKEFSWKAFIDILECGQGYE